MRSSRFHPSNPTNRPSRRGAATVEMAIVLPFLMFVFALAVDFSRIYYAASVLSQSARVGAYVASDPNISKTLPYATPNEAVLAAAVDLPTPPTVTVTTGTDALDLTYVEVKVQYTFQTITRFPGIPQTWPLTRTVRMRSIPDEVE